MSVLVVMVGTMSVAATIPPDMAVVAENDFLRLYLNSATTEFAVEDHESGDVWYSNPLDRQTKETIARGRALDQLGAQFSILYYTPGDLERRMDNYNDSIVHGQFAVSELQNGVRIDYELGVEFERLAHLPRVLSKESWDAFIDGIDDPAGLREIEQLWGRNYTLVSLVPLDEGEELVTMPNFDTEGVFGSYKIIAVGRNLTRNQQRDQMRNLTNTIFDSKISMENRNEFTSDHLDPFRNREVYLLNERVPQFMLESLEDALIKNGFTIEHKQAEYEAFNLDPPLRNLETFTIPIEYRLDGKDFVVRIPVDEIVYPLDVIDEGGRFGPRDNEVTLPLHRIQVLDFFGAADREQEGYLFVPDGSGAIILLNSGRTTSPPYVAPVYGRDLSEELVRERLTETQRIHLPVFGMKQDERGFLAIIEQGEALARIRADIAGRNYSYNTVFSEFVVIPRGRTGLTGNVELARSRPQGIRETINIYQSRIYEGDIQIRYKFLHGENANYAGMAWAYRSHLIDQGALQKKDVVNPSVPFILELVGAVQKRRPILGIPRDVIEPLTTFQQAQHIVSELMASGVEDIKVRYSGWMQGGIEHVFPMTVRLERRLGGPENFTQLVEFLEHNGVVFYPNVGFQRVLRDRLFDGFHAASDAARRLDRTVAVVYEYDLATFQSDSDRTHYLMSPARLERVVDGFLGTIKPYDIGGISVSDFGNEVHSDFRQDSALLIDRQQAVNIVADQARKFKDLNFRVMIEGGNAYILPFADSIVHIPLTSSEYRLFHESIPFIQIVLRGYLDFAGPPLNLAQDYRRTLLKTIETGAALYYKWSFEPSEVVKESRHHALYSLHYNDWIAESVSLYHEVSAAMRSVAGQPIAAHRRLAPDVYETAYENGVKVLVNYNSHAVEVDGIHVDAKNFRVIEGAH